MAGNVYTLFASCPGSRWLYEFNRLRYLFGQFAMPPPDTLVKNALVSITV